MPIMTVGQARSPGCQPARRERIEKMGKRKPVRPKVVEALEERQLLSGGLGYLLPHVPVMHFRHLAHQTNQLGSVSGDQALGAGLRAHRRALHAQVAALRANNGSTGSTDSSSTGSANIPTVFALTSASTAASTPALGTTARTSLGPPVTTLPPSTSTPSTTAPPTVGSTTTASGTATVTAAPTPASTPTLPPLVSPAAT